jgi:hypothetical protein
MRSTAAEFMLAAEIHQRQRTMPTINISVSEVDCNKLKEDYRKMAIAWPRSGRTDLPPSFEEWLAARAMNGDTTVTDMRVFAAIEKTVTSLQAHGFGLAHFGNQGPAPQESAQALAASLVTDLKLSQHQQKRIRELFGYYAKTAKEIADAGHVGVTNRAYGALHETYRELAERTANATERLGEQRAVGRVEGAIAVLVGMNVMDRETATEKTDTFKLQVRNPKK